MKIYEDEVLEDLFFSNFKIIQKKKGMRFGIDAILLSHFCDAKMGSVGVDLCTGSGIIPILVTKKNIAHITGVEIQKSYADMARRSIEICGLSDKIDITEGDIKNFPPKDKLNCFDFVTVNPPYKEAGGGLVSPNEEIAAAKFEILCTLDDVLAAANRSLRSKGKIYLVHRVERLCDIMCKMRSHALEPKRIVFVKDKECNAPILLLVEGQKGGGKKLVCEKTIIISDGNYKV